MPQQAYFRSRPHSSTHGAIEMEEGHGIFAQLVENAHACDAHAATQFMHEQKALQVDFYEVACCHTCIWTPTSWFEMLPLWTRGAKYWHTRPPWSSSRDRFLSARTPAAHHPCQRESRGRGGNDNRAT